jgi:hypothetical protein
MGFFIPHLPLPPAPANLLAPIISIASGSKSHFGAHNTKLENGPVAFACLFYVNLNLNCAGAVMPPLPSGFVLALFQVTMVNVTLGDIIAGALHLVVDLFIQFALNRGLGKLGEYLGNRVAGALANRIFGKGILEMIGFTTVGELLTAILPRGRAAQIIGYSLEQVPSILLGDVLGTPVGYSWSKAPTSQFEDHGLDAAHEAVAESIDNMLNSPSVEQHPSAPPPNATPAPALGTP